MKRRSIVKENICTPHSWWGLMSKMALPRWCTGKVSACQCRRHKRRWFDSWVGKIPWKRKWRSSPVFLPGNFNGQRSLVGYSPWHHKESDTTEWACTCMFWYSKWLVTFIRVTSRSVRREKENFETLIRTRFWRALYASLKIFGINFLGYWEPLQWLIWKVSYISNIFY